MVRRGLRHRKPRGPPNADIKQTTTGGPVGAVLALPEPCQQARRGNVLLQCFVRRPVLNLPCPGGFAAEEPSRIYPIREAKGSGRRDACRLDPQGGPSWWAPADPVDQQAE